MRDAATDAARILCLLIGYVLGSIALVVADAADRIADWSEWWCDELEDDSL